MQTINKKSNILRNVFLEKCPNCGNGDVFQKKSGLFTIPQTLKKCNNCSFQYEKEPGFFIGAMYVSYGLGILQGCLSFLLYYFFLPTLPPTILLAIIISPIFILMKKNYKWARIIYISIFK